MSAPTPPITHKSNPPAAPTSLSVVAPGAPERHPAMNIDHRRSDISSPASVTSSSEGYLPNNLVAVPISFSAALGRGIGGRGRGRGGRGGQRPRDSLKMKGGFFGEGSAPKKLVIERHTDGCECGLGMM
ncbi:hypothetical protein Salat_0258400 [Sesamum alatum]|uniref:Uncharacterized protein n=1 Tax=Sesamum alatum TaxID=300844 RepID=A0AAE2CYM5_9LAMI|nr:hypothetical protein Salat_0258400 [Sesamum alatum]